MQGLRVNGAMSRAQIARASGLVPQTVSNIIDDLQREGLVLAADPVRAGRGQPATPYFLAANGAFALGLQIDLHHVRAVAVNLLGDVIFSREAALSLDTLQQNLPVILSALDEAQRAVVQLAGTDQPRILGIGAAMPAPTGVHLRRHDPWLVPLTDRHPLVEALTRETGLTVGLHHDASAAAVAERVGGSMVDVESFVLIFVSYGIGAGIYVQGELSRGHRGLAGELGQVRVQAGSTTSPLESCASLKPLLDGLDLEPNHPDVFEELARITNAGSCIVDRWIATSATHLAWAIETIQCLIDPECVVIAGQMPEVLMTRLFDAILAEQEKNRSETGVLPLQPRRGSTSRFSVAAGAAADPISRAFDPSLAAMMKS